MPARSRSSLAMPPSALEALSSRLVTSSSTDLVTIALMAVISVKSGALSESDSPSMSAAAFFIFSSKSSQRSDSAESLADISSRLALAASPALAVGENQVKAKAAAQITARRVSMGSSFARPQTNKKWFARRDYTDEGD